MANEASREMQIKPDQEHIFNSSIEKTVHLHLQLHLTTEYAKQGLGVFPGARRCTDRCCSAEHLIRGLPKSSRCLFFAFNNRVFFFFLYTPMKSLSSCFILVAPVAQRYLVTL